MFGEGVVLMNKLDDVVAHFWNYVSTYYFQPWQTQISVASFARYILCSENASAPSGFQIFCHVNWNQISSLDHCGQALLNLNCFDLLN